MKTKIVLLLGVIAVMALSSLRPSLAESEKGSGGKPGAAPAKTETLYTCGMHPQVIQNKPGNCPICGMKLTPMLKSATGAITIDPVTVQNMNFRSEAVKRGPVSRVIRTVGVIDFDETKVVEVTTKFDGWVEKLHADTTGQQVHRGDPLFEMYSPDYYKMQVEFIAAINSAVNMPSAAARLRAGARTNLLALGVPAERVAELEKGRGFNTNYLVVAPTDGFLVEKMILQGQKVDAGMKLYRIADLGLVWVQAQVYEQDLPFITLGQEADVSLSDLPDRRFRGRVTYIYPTVDEKTRTAKVRMEFHNPGYLLKPGMFTTVELKAELAHDAVLVPDSAVLRSGERNTVFVALPGGKFEPRVVTLGARGQNDDYQVFNGVTEGERVVTSGQFMLDSESQLREAIQKMMNAGAVPAPTGESNPATLDGSRGRSPHPAEAGTSTSAIFICPMPEHVSIRYDHSGKCPLCGMALVPVSEATLNKIQPGGLIEYYTCPMTEDCPTPNHGTVHLDKPGKCPVCGMTLIPVMEAPKTEAKPASEPAPGAAVAAKLYTCPMPVHGDVVTDKPGDCPKCGMTLVPTSEVAHGKVAEENWRKAQRR